MAQAFPRISLSTARDIPFNKLILSQQNVRKIKAGISIDDLAQDIAHRGLLSSLNVRAELDADANETGIYRIFAGGRRYRALEILVIQKRLAKTAGVPCIVSTGKTSEIEDPFAENAHRVELHPLDQCRAFQALRGEGLDEETIAGRFFVPVQTVKQRLRMASVSPRLLDLYANDEISHEQIMAFSITNDHVRQEQVWDTVSRSHVKEPYYIRRLLTETAVRASDRRAVYVGTDVYEAAGGVVMRDLFEQDGGGWLQDPATLEQLVLEKLKVDAEALKKEEGWKWVDAALDFSYGHTAGLRRFYGEQTEFSDGELARHDALKAEYDTLEAKYAQAEDYSEEIERRLAELATALDGLNERPYIFNVEDVARGGVFISLSANGDLTIERGFVRPEDEPVPEADGYDHVGSEIADIKGQAASAAAIAGRICVNGRPVSVEQQEEEDDTFRPLPDRQVLDLMAARTVALRNALANDPVMAFIAVLHAFVLKTFYLYGSHSCLQITLQSAKFAQTPGLTDTPWANEINQRQEAWGQDLPKYPDALWDYLIQLDDVSRQVLFAHCASLSVNAVIEPCNKRVRALAHADQVARAISFDTAEAGWTPTSDNYLGRVTKMRILQAVREAKDDQAAQVIEDLRKPDMAREAARLIKGSGWMPEPLRDANHERTEAEDIPADDHVVDASNDAGELPAFFADGIEASGVDNDDNGHDEAHLDAAK